MKFEEPFEQYLGKWITYGELGEGAVDKEFLYELKRKSDRDPYFRTITIWGKPEFSVFYPVEDKDRPTPKEIAPVLAEPREEDKKKTIKFIFKVGIWL